MIGEKDHGNKSNTLVNDFESFGIADYDVGFLNNVQENGSMDGYVLDEDGNYPEEMFA